MVVEQKTWEEIDRLFDFYLANQAHFVAGYDGKYIVLAGNEVQGAFDSSGSAYDFAIQHFVPGEFLIQKCSPGDRDYTTRLFSGFRV
jgi:hypothetical protein